MSNPPQSPPGSNPLPSTRGAVGTRVGRVRSLALGVIGPGRVGGEFLRQLRAARHRLLIEMGLELRLRGVIASQRMWLSGAGAISEADESDANAAHPAHLDDFVSHVCSAPELHPLLVDCSASDDVADHYLEWLKAGIHVVTPNKLAGSGSISRWQAIRTACNHGTAWFRCEATVCAGLPVVQTLRDFVDTGDELLDIHGMFSGTLAWLCSRYDGSQPFSALLREAHALGYTEPDPRADLSGTDVARKLVILAREAGLAMSLEDVAVESLVPPALAGRSAPEFLAHMDALDAPMAARLAGARANGGVLRHVGRVDRDGGASVRLEVLPRNHPFAHTRLTDNIVQVRTARYHDNPLIVQGPGAGPDVTAAAVFADLLRVAESVEARP